MDPNKLRQKAANKIEAAGDILKKAEAENRELTEEEERFWQQYHDESKELVKKAERLEEQQRSEERLSEPQNDPVQPERSEEEKPEIEVKEKRWNRSYDFFKSVMDFSSGNREGKPVRNLMDWNEECRASGLNETLPSEGGFLVPDEFLGSIRETIWTTGSVFNRVERIPSSTGGTLKIPAVHETSRADGSRKGGLQVYWVKEGGAITTSAPKFRMIEFGLQKLAAAVYLTEELMQDAPALESWLSNRVPEELKFVAENSILVGTGAGEPLGVLNSGAVISVSKEGGQAANTIVAENVLKMYSRMQPQSMSNAVWFINQDCLPQLMQMAIEVGTGGIPVFLPPGGFSQTPYGQLLGRPVIPVEYCKTVGTAGDIIFADMSEYGLRERGDIQSASSMHVRFLYDEQVMKFTWRIDGQPFLNSPITPLNGSNTVSPFITLESRD